MKRQALIIAVGMMLVLLGMSPAIASNQPTNPGTPNVQNSDRADDAKERERKEEERKKEEARVEAEKRKLAEEQKRREAEEVKAKDDAAHKEEARKAQERKAQEEKEVTRKREEDRKAEERKAEERRAEERKRDELRRAEEDKRRDDERRKDEARRIEEGKRREEDRRKDEARREHDRRDEEQKRKDREARLEAEKRRQIEREARREEERRRRIEREERERREHETIVYVPVTQPETTVIVTPQSMDGGATVSVPVDATPAATSNPPTTATSMEPTVTAEVPTVSYPPHAYRYEPPAPKAYVGVVFAPGEGERKPAIGLQYLTKRYGVGVWFSGSLGKEGNVIDGTIPHDDYYTTSRRGTYGVEALVCTGSDAAMLIFGAGLSVQQTYFTDVSNATGWKWDGGDETEVKPAAQIGCRFRIGGRVSMQIGYDTAQSAFFGLSAGF